MPAENADYISQLVKSKPSGGESISEGDDHLRAIKTAVTQSFPNISSAVTSSPAELNAVGKTSSDLAALTTVVDNLGGDVGDIDSQGHGNVASCYYNTTVGFGSAGLVYKHNVSNVVAKDTVQTSIIFQTPLDGTGALSHFAFSITPVSGTGNPTMITITETISSQLSFIAWHLVGGTWEAITPAECSFSLMVNDMDKSQ